MFKTSRSKLILSLSLILTLCACQTTTEAQEKAARSSKIDAALEQAAISAAVQGKKKQSLSYLEKLYKRNSSDPVAAISYGASLREAGEYERAGLVLFPFANVAASPAVAKTEYAAVQLALGDNDEAEKFAQKAVLQDETDARAFHYLGIALDSKGEHEKAERALRKGLEIWKGDPVPIMNNLALNLAAQGHLEEALEILKKAKAVAPNRIEVERNLRIVKALQESYSYAAPKKKKSE